MSRVRRFAAIALLLIALVLGGAWVWSMWYGCDASRRLVDSTPGGVQHVTVLQRWWAAVGRGRVWIAYQRDRITVPAANSPIPLGGFTPSQLHQRYWRFDARRGADYGGPSDAPQWVGALGIAWRFNGRMMTAPPANGGTSSGYYHLVSIPHWLLIVLALLTAWRLDVRHWFGRTRESGTLLCRGCGYDVRATPDRCPECGLHQPGFGATDEAASA